MTSGSHEVFVALYESNHVAGGNHSLTQLVQDSDGRLRFASFPKTLEFSYGEKLLSFVVNRHYQVQFSGNHPTDEFGNRIVEISGIIVTGRDEDGHMQPFITDPHIVFEQTPQDYDPPNAILLTPYEGMEIYDMFQGKIILSIPVEY